MTNRGASGLTAAIIIPVFNRSDLLERTLASLTWSLDGQDGVEVIVADDGSDEDVAGVARRFDQHLRLRVVHQDHRGFGAGRARNMGARSTDADVLVFLDSDCMAPAGFLDAHLGPHGQENHSVVIGPRRHVAMASLSIADVSAGRIDLEGLAEEPRIDFRSVLRRRSAGFRRGDEGFRAFVSSNVSLPRGLFEEVGGFDERFRWWGSEDTELGWRLWQAGTEFRFEDSAVVFHQTDVDMEGGRAGRDRARALNDGLLSSLVPHRFYRKPGRYTAIPEVPKVSVVVHTLAGGDAEPIWSNLSSGSFEDFEIVFAADAALHDPFAGSTVGDPRISFVDGGHDRAFDQARGEITVLLHGAVAPHPRLLANVVRRFDRRPALSTVTVGYEVPGDPALQFRNSEDTATLDAAWGSRVPLVAAVRTRRLRLVRQRLAVDEALTVLAGEPSSHIPMALASVPHTTPVPRPEGFAAHPGGRQEAISEIRHNPLTAPRVAVRFLRSRRSGAPSGPAQAVPLPIRRRDEDQAPPVLRYVGWVGKDNVGDEAMLEASRRLMPWATIEPRGEHARALLLGGGTLINRRIYLKWLHERDSPRLERAVLGTGVADPDFWGLTEDPAEWVEWLGTCAYVGVRGPRSEARLRSWGYDGPLEVCGDLALAGARPDGVRVEPGRIVVAPAWTGGELWGGSDETVEAALAGAIATWVAEGRDVRLLACHPTDDRPIIDICRRAGHPDLHSLAGYRDIEQATSLLASAEVVVGERLHACVLAALSGRPFVGVEYQPKLRDFAASLDLEHRIIGTDGLRADRIAEEVAAIDVGSESEHITERVDEYRRRLARAADVVRDAIGA